MITKQTLLKQIVQERENRRRVAEQRVDDYIEKLKKEKPEFNDIYLKVNLANLELLKAKHTFSSAQTKYLTNFNQVKPKNSNEDFSENDLMQTELETLLKDFENKKNKLAQLESELNNFLKSNNISPKRLKPQYKCSKCEDKGIISGKLCTCLAQELNERLSTINSTYANFNTFEMINPNLMTEGLTKIYKELYDWCDNPNDIININLLGDVGTGKTFLLECITSKLVKSQKDVIFTTAFNFNEECRRYHYSMSDTIEKFLNCSFLVIDDLGTEPNLKNISQEYLYNVINLRQVNRKPTLISTNLSLEQLVDRYGLRTVSRLVNKQCSKTFVISGVDKRTI